MSRLDCRPVRSDERGHSGGQISGKFMAVASLWLITTALALLVSCQWSPFPRNPLNAPHPYRMKVVRQVSIVPPEVFADLDHDGVDEILGLSKIYSTFTPSFLQIYNSRFETIQRVNFNGLIQNLFCYDWNGDGIDEIFLPFTRNDSTFLRIIDHRGNILIRSAFLFTGKARVDSSGYYPWQGKILQMFYADINADEKNEIVVIPSEGLARAPRGVFVYDGTSLRRKWKYEIGPAISFYPYLLDPDGDGKFNILLPTSSPMNGNVANGTSDENGYLILLGPDGEVLSQEKLTGAFGGINARVADLDHDGHQEILLMLTNALEPPRFRLEMRDAKSLKLLRSFALTGAAGFEIAQLNHEPEMEIVVDVTNGPLMILNAKFEVLQRKQNYGLMNRIDVVRDFTGDGLDDIVLYANDRDYLLDAQLNIKLEFENKVVVKPLHSKFQLYHDGSALPLVPVFDGQQTKLVTLERNRYYWLQIYGPPLGMLLSIGLFVGLIAFAMSHRRKARFYQYALEIESGLFNTPILILDPRMRLIFTNSYGADFFNIAPGQKKVAVAKLSLQDKRVSDFLQMLGTCDPVQQKLEVISDETPQEGFRIFAEPFGRVEERRPYWLVLVQDLTPETELQRAKTWAATAQRIAHDLKNPLSSMLLSVQRLQSEYRKHDPVAAKRYDPFVSRIINRIESLRRTSRNFMKFLSLEKLNLQPTQLKDLIDCFLKSGLVEFPPDIHLVTKFADDLPMIHVDQEQMQTLLENLITNAIDAMPDGGTLTISVFLENDLHLSHQKGPGDYVVVEVMDTGKGIPESVRDHLFKPYATGSPKGTGLGLTIVKKIVEDHDGFIEVNSEVETGTTFCIYLPLQVL